MSFTRTPIEGFVIPGLEFLGEVNGYVDIYWGSPGRRYKAPDPPHVDYFAFKDSEGREVIFSTLTPEQFKELENQLWDIGVAYAEELEGKLQAELEDRQKNRIIKGDVEI